MAEMNKAKEGQGFRAALRDAWAAAWLPRSSPARGAWSDWRAARKSWRQHALEPGVFFPGWAILMAALMVFASGTLLLGVFRHWGEWSRPAETARLWTMLGASFASGIVGPFEILRRGRRISDLRREIAHERDPQWAPIERQLRGKERAAREAYELAKECARIPAGGDAGRVASENSCKKETNAPRRSARRI